MLVDLGRRINLKFFDCLLRLYRFISVLVLRLCDYHPFGSKPVAPREEYLKLALTAKARSYPQVDDYERQVGYAINEEWLHDLALHTQIVIKKSPLCYAHGRILYSALSRYLVENPPAAPTDRITILETGTARGFSALCMARAMADQSRAGILFTFDLLPHQIPIYWNCIDDHETPKSRVALLKPWHELLERYIVFHQGDTHIELRKIHPARIHFAFIDGAHDYEDIKLEASHIVDKQELGDVIVFDDYSPAAFPGLVRAVDEVCRNYSYAQTVITAQQSRGYLIAIKT